MRGALASAQASAGEQMSAMESKAGMAAVHASEAMSGLESELQVSQQAAETAAETGEILARVKHARLSLEYVEVLQGVRKALGLGRLPAQMTTPDYVRALREPPGTDPQTRSAEKGEALRRLEDFIERCEADGMTHFGEVPYTVRSYCEALAAPLRTGS